MLTKARGALMILRPELALAAGLCVMLGSLLALGTLPPLPVLIPGFVCGFCLSGSALVTNDYFDLEVDRLNAPHRPLPAGLLSPAEALGLGLLMALIGWVAAGLLGLLAFSLSLLIWLLGFLYNWRLKAAGLWGNLVVSSSVGFTFLLGGIVAGQPWNPLVWTFALLVFVFDLAEEIAGDAMDAEGDRQRGSRSIAIVAGPQTALRIATLLFGVVVLLSFLPLLWGVGWLYLLIISLTDILLIVFVSRLRRSQTPTAGRQAMRGLYLSGTLGLLAFLVGSLLS